jgi:hypothetical protein
MQVVVLVVAGILIWAGATLLLDAWWRREHRPDLAERLWPFRSRSLAEEAQEWLDRES